MHPFSGDLEMLNEGQCPSRLTFTGKRTVTGQRAQSAVRSAARGDEESSVDHSVRGGRPIGPDCRRAALAIKRAHGADIVGLERLRSIGIDSRDDRLTGRAERVGRGRPWSVGTPP
jgi:hypothetical protein